MSGAPTPRPPGTCPAPSVELVALTRCPWAHQDDSSDVRRDRISTSSNPWTPTPSTLTLAEWLHHSGDGDGDGTCGEWTTAEWDDRRMGQPPSGRTTASSREGWATSIDVCPMFATSSRLPQGTKTAGIH